MSVVQEAGDSLGVVDNIASGAVSKLAARVYFLSNDQVEEVALTAGRLERAAFLLRGACGWVMRRRYEDTRKDGDIPLHRKMVALAARWGVDYSSLMRDIQIYERWFSPNVIVDPDDPGEGLEATAPEISAELPRYLYVEALVAPDPDKALAMMEAKHHRGNYSRADARSDVDDLKRTHKMLEEGFFADDKTVRVIGKDGAPQKPPVESAAVLDEGYLQDKKTLKVRVDPSQMTALFGACRARGSSAEDIFLEWIEQGCLLLSNDAQSVLKNQHAAYCQSRGRVSMGEYIEWLIQQQQARIDKGKAI